MSETKLARWDAKASYKFGLGCGYYLNGVRRVVSKGAFVEIPVNVEKYRSLMYRTTEFMVDRLKEANETAPFVILDDQAPIRMDVERLIKITDPHPFLYVRLPVNMGVGGKENILQHVLQERCKYMLRWDADVAMEALSLPDIESAFHKLPDAWAITSCITYFARLEAASLPARQNLFAGSNIADFVAYRCSVFKELGYADPALRINEDGDMRLRALAKLNMQCYVDKRITGKAIPSGANMGAPSRVEVGEYIAKTRPFAKVVFPRNGSFRLLLDKKKLDIAQDFYIGPHEYATKLAAVLWK
jgi:hypothetical protein